MAAMFEGSRVPEVLEKLVAPHVESFDWFLQQGLPLLVAAIPRMEVEHPLTNEVYQFWWEHPTVGKPAAEDALPGADTRLFPRDCREAGTTYRAPFTLELCYCRAGGTRLTHHQTVMGSLPVMVRSAACYLRSMTRPQLLAAHEESTEMGGYFICNGIERIIRCLILQRRHYVMALRRGAYTKRGSNYTEAATLVRCVRPDESSATVRCHYLTDGAVNFAFTLRRAEYFLPAGLLLKCFLEVSDLELYKLITSGATPSTQHASFLSERAQLLLGQISASGLTTKHECLAYMGSHFRGVITASARASDAEVGEQLLADHVFVHLTTHEDKGLLLLHMLHKLYGLVNLQCGEDNPDALTHHELLLPGTLLARMVKEKLGEALEALKEAAARAGRDAPEALNLLDEKTVRKLADRMPDIGRKVEYLLNTGNLASPSGLDLSQAAGFTVVAEKLNWFRYLSHFRSVHRGAYFAELRTTTVRKLLPEGWGFLCPVHTPDGSPCGLLNHFAAACRVVTHPPPDPAAAAEAVTQVLTRLGLVPPQRGAPSPPPSQAVQVVMDGRVVGHMAHAAAAEAAGYLRVLKAAALPPSSPSPSASAPAPPSASAAAAAAAAAAAPRPPRPPSSGSVAERRVAALPPHLEVVLLPGGKGQPFPGLYLFTSAARMVRPVRQLRSGQQELIGTLEQTCLAIAVPDGGDGGSAGMRFTHSENAAASMLSVVASMTPYSDYNQSPRNMYQCQMGKQTMGSPATALPHRTDNKLYRLQSPQTPVARTGKYVEYGMDEFPQGTNAVVAVLAYTGYDMEDAMILNKASMERGFAHGSLIKTEMVDLREEGGGRMRGAAPTKAFGVDALPPEKLVIEERPTGAFGQTLPQNRPSLSTSAAAQRPRRPAPRTPSAAAADAALPPAVQALPSHKEAERVDVDGLPHVGAVVWPDQGYYCVRDEVDGRVKATKLKGEEVATVEQVTLVGGKGKGGATRANIQMRFNRNPVIGDKFSSRHGQKGVLSILWPDTDMPYSAATGMRPDLLINPHAFPSRMTIGMLVESLVSKAGALEGRFVDASPFQRCDGLPGKPLEEFGAALEAAGFARAGQETFISGVTGEEMAADIFVGVVYYQRLRHMVSDKFQVRAMGKINPLTKQPVKGRKQGGGIRFGEMERDSLLAHGAAYLLHDRLHSCSDYSVMDVCTCCGSILSPLTRPAPVTGLAAGNMRGASKGKVVCQLCDGSSRYIDRVAMPFVFKYLAAELAAMNIRVTVGTK